jgi:hypothetical protein
MIPQHNQGCISLSPLNQARFDRLYERWGTYRLARALNTNAATIDRLAYSGMARADTVARLVKAMEGLL